MSPFLPRCTSVFFLHRFAWPEQGVTGHNPEILRSRLEYLRKHRYRLLSVGQLLSLIEAGHRPHERVAVFTVDDGYADFAAVAAPIFAAYDCPVTVFLITDFTSGKLWNWFDKIPWIIDHAERRATSITLGAHSLRLQWEGEGARNATAEAIVERLKRVPDAEKEQSILLLAKTLEVELPSTVPQRDRAMSWDEVRSCARAGVTYGPHTVTHPILSQVGSERSEFEITESWRRVAAESGAPVPVFCYPNGTPSDFSPREQSAVARAGMKAAFSTVEASITPGRSADKTLNRFAIPRFVYPDSEAAFVQAASGLEALRGRVVRA